MYLRNTVDGHSLVSGFSKASGISSSRSPDRDRFSLRGLKKKRARDNGSPFLGLSDLGSNSALLDQTFQNQLQSLGTKDGGSARGTSRKDKKKFPRRRAEDSFDAVQPLKKSLEAAGDSSVSLKRKFVNDSTTARNLA